MIHRILELLGIWSVFLPALTGIFCINRLDQSSKIVWVMSVLACLPQMAKIAPFMNGKRYAFYNFYVPIEFFLSAFLLLRILKAKTLFCTIILFTFFFIGFYSWLVCGKNFSSHFFSECVAITNLMIVTGILFIIYHAIREDLFSLNWKHPDTYYTIGLFFYAPITVVIYTFWNTFQVYEKEFSDLRVIHYTANALMYFLFAIGIYKNFHFKSKLTSNKGS